MFSEGAASFLINNIIKKRYSSEMLAVKPEYLNGFIYNVVLNDPSKEPATRILGEHFNIFSNKVKERLTRIKQKVSVSTRSILIKLGMRTLSNDHVCLFFFPKD
jgi:hypothetical protein